MVALVKDNFPADKAPLYSFIIGAAFLSLGLACSLVFLSNKAFRCGKASTANPKCGAPCLAVDVAKS